MLPGRAPPRGARRDDASTSPHAANKGTRDATRSANSLPAQRRKPNLRAIRAAIRLLAPYSMARI